MTLNIANFKGEGVILGENHSILVLWILATALTIMTKKLQTETKTCTFKADNGIYYPFQIGKVFAIYV